MPRLPQPGGDVGNWGNILNEYLSAVHNSDGTLRSDIVAESNLTEAVRDKLNAVASGGATHLSTTSTATTVTVASDTGNDATLSSATGSAAGILTAADKSKLDGIAAGAEVNTVASVAGKTGAVALVKADVGLGNVDNTSDASKPISTAVQTALAGKSDTSHTHSGYAATSHSHAIADTSGLQAALDGKAATSHSHALGTISDVTITTPVVGHVLKYNGTGWINDTDQTSGGGGGSTNLSATTTTTTMTVVSDTGTDATLSAATGSAAGVLTAADKTKLDGVATAATANASDAQLRDRTTHTGTQTASTISDFSSAADARITAANKKTDSMTSGRLLGRGTTGTGAIEEITLGTNLSLSGTTLNATGGGGGATNLSATTNATSVTVASDTGTDATLAAATTSAAGVLTAADKTKLDGVATAATANASDAQLRDRSTHTGTQTASTISDFAETVRDTMGTALVAGANVTITPNDVGDTITIAASGGSGGVAPQSTKTGSYTLALADADAFIKVDSASATTISIPTNASVAFPIGTEIRVAQMGAGEVAFTSGGTTTSTVSVLGSSTTVRADAVVSNFTYPLNIPSQATAGTALVAWISMANRVAVWSPPSGWTEIGTGADGPSGAGGYLFVRHNIPGGLAGTQQNFVASNVGTSGPPAAAIVVAVDGADLTNMIGTQHVTSGTASVQTTPALTTNTASSLELGFVFASSGSSAESVHTVPSGMTLVNAIASGGSAAPYSRAAIARGSAPVASGTNIGGRVWGNSSYGGTRTVAIRPNVSSNVTIRSAEGAMKTAAQYADAVLTKIGTDEWLLTGYLTT